MVRLLRAVLKLCRAIGPPLKLTLPAARGTAYDNLRKLAHFSIESDSVKFWTIFRPKLFCRV